MKTTQLLLALGLALGTTAAFAQTTPAPASTTAPAAAAATPAPAASNMGDMNTAKPMHKHHRHHRRHRHHHHKAAKKVNDHDKDDMNKTSTDANKSS